MSSDRTDASWDGSEVRASERVFLAGDYTCVDDGVLMPFGLGLGVLFLALYKGRSANRFGLLTGQIVADDETRWARAFLELRQAGDRHKPVE